MIGKHVRLMVEKTTFDITEKYLEESDRQAQYRALFQKILSKYGVSSPDQLDDEKKKAFFNEVDKSWNAEKETD